MSDDPMVGQVIEGRYAVLGILGQGGMGAVYRAEQTAMGRIVALKMLRRDFGQDEQLVERFQREARNSALLEHPNTVRVFDFGRTAAGDLFLVMELLSGKELADVIGDGLVPSKVIHICRQIARSVAEAHNKGLVHRDLKPANVQIVSVEGDDSFVKVLDFGLAKLTQKDDADRHDQSLTSAGAALGTPLYMSPEQCAGVKVDSRCDIYALGCILFEMLTGRPPFVGASAVMTMTMHIRDDVPGLQQTRPDRVFPPQLEAIIRRCMEKEADRRFQKMEEVVVALDAAHQAISAGFVPSTPAMPTAGGGAVAMDMTVTPDSGILLAQAVSAQLSAPRQVGLGETMGSDPAGVAPAALWGSQPGAGGGIAPLPDGLSRSSMQSLVAGEVAPMGAAGRATGGAGKLVAAAAVVALAAAAGAYFALRGPGRAPEATGAAGPAATAPAATAAPKAEAAPAAAAAPAADPIVIQVTGEPAGAAVKIAGLPAGVLPMEYRHTGPEAQIRIEVEQAGYEPHSSEAPRAAAVDGRLTVDVALKKLKKKKKGKKKASEGYEDFGEDDYEDF